MTSQAVMKRYLTSVAKNNEEYKDNKTIQSIVYFISIYKKLDAEEKEELDAKIEIAYGKLQAKGVSASKSTSKATTTRRTKSSTDGGLKGILADLKKKLGAEKFKDATTGTDILKDIQIPALKKGKRIVRKKGKTTNQYGTFKNKVGRAYWESRANRYDANQPSQTRKYKLADGGQLNTAKYYWNTFDKERKIDFLVSAGYSKSVANDLSNENWDSLESRVHKNLLAVLMADGGTTTSLSSIKRKYLKNEDENAHSENVVLLAKHFGDAEDLKLAKQILAKHNKEGHLSSENAKERNELHLKLIRKARTKFGEEGIEFAKGGLTEHGLEVGDEIVMDVKKTTMGKMPTTIGVKDYDKEFHLVDLDKGERYAKGGEVSYFSKTKKGVNFLFEEGDKGKVRQILSNGKFGMHDATILEKYAAEQNDGSFYPFYYVQLNGLNNKSLYAQDELIDTFAKGGEVSQYIDGLSKQEVLSKSIVYDNGGESYDRYTIFTPDGSVYGMSETAEGFNQYIGDSSEIEKGKHLGRKLRSVPKGIQSAVLDRMLDDEQMFAKGGEVKTPIKIKKQLESIRKSIQNENVSYAELAELQSLSKYIDPNDIELREWAGIPEFEDGEEFAKGGTTKRIKRKGC